MSSEFVSFTNQWRRVNFPLPFYLQHITHHHKDRYTHTIYLSRSHTHTHKLTVNGVLHSTVQWTERVALHFVEHILLQQHLHTSVMAWGEEEMEVIINLSHSHTEKRVEKD